MVTFDTTLHTMLHISVHGGGRGKLISAYCVTKNDGVLQTGIKPSPLPLPVLRTFLIFVLSWLLLICINRNPFPPIINLHVPPFKKTTKSNPQQKTPRKFSFILSLFLGVYCRHSVLTLKYFYCSFFVTVNGFDCSLLMLYFLTQSLAVLERKRWI